MDFGWSSYFRGIQVSKRRYRFLPYICGTCTTAVCIVLLTYSLTLIPIIFEHISGNAQIANRLWSGTSTQSASADITNKAVRPHTAHGARTADISGEGFSSRGAAGDGDEAAPVVAGARGMMRYGKDNSPNTSITFCDYLLPRVGRSDVGVCIGFVHAKHCDFQDSTNVDPPAHTQDAHAHQM